MKKPKVLSIILLSLCIAAVIAVVASAFQTKTELQNLTDFLRDPSREPPQIGVALFYFAIILASCLVEIIFSSVGLTFSLWGMKTAPNRAFKGIFIGSIVVFFIVILLVSGIAVFILSSGG